MNQGDLEWSLIYSLIVAGKSASFAEAANHRLWELLPGHYSSPLEFVRAQMAGTSWQDGLINKWLRDGRTGNYTKLGKALREIGASAIKLDTCGPDELQRIHGIGPKTARFFILWTRPDARYAVLDRHILAWMGEQGYKVPKSTPQNRRMYRRLEKQFIEEADKRGLTPRQFDYKIWQERSGYQEESGNAVHTG